MIRVLSPTAMPRLLARRKARLAEAEAVVRPILEAVRTRGDKALLAYARRFDALDRKTVVVPTADLRSACAGLAPEFRDAVSAAAANIRAFAEMSQSTWPSAAARPGAGCSARRARPSPRPAPTRRSG
jgi:histidinol dehydrogenase